MGTSVNQPLTDVPVEQSTRVSKREHDSRRQSGMLKGTEYTRERR